MSTSRTWKVAGEQVPADCGCVNYIGGDIGFCKLHAAAPELAEALADLLKEFHQHVPEDTLCGHVSKAVVRANAVLKGIRS